MGNSAICCSILNIPNRSSLDYSTGFVGIGGSMGFTVVGETRSLASDTLQRGLIALALRGFIGGIGFANSFVDFA